MRARQAGPDSRNGIGWAIMRCAGMSNCRGMDWSVGVGCRDLGRVVETEWSGQAGGGVVGWVMARMVEKDLGRYEEGGRYGSVRT